ncbi:MAG: hypothetical protein ACW99G_12910 [Candidatus Thorarchaeota archaeon]|jgi:hypothetical protein
MIKVNDEFNPHIVWQLNQVDEKKLKPYYTCDEGGELRNKKVKQIHDTFIKKYNEIKDFVLSNKGGEHLCEKLGVATNIRNGNTWRGHSFVPLAYRLDVLTEAGVSLKKDVLSADKFGGIPDLTDDYWFSYVNAERDDSIDMDRFFELVWPKCDCCDKHMKFIGQTNLADEKFVISLLTERNVGLREKMSAFGWLESRREPENMRNSYYYCPCNNWDSWNSDAYVSRQHVWSEEVFPKNKENVAEYRKKATAFMEKHELHNLKDEVLMVAGYDLNFDLDDEIGEKVGLGQYEYSELGWDVRDLYKPDTYYTLYGKPASQQVPKRPYDPNSYGCLFRQAPILSWDDDDDDMTHQMYGNMRIRSVENVKGWMDSSCT